MENESINYFLPVHLGETTLEIDGTTFLVEAVTSAKTAFSASWGS